jgi:hypothetical protein
MRAPLDFAPLEGGDVRVAQRGGDAGAASDASAPHADKEWSLRQPSILDVVHGVKGVATTHPEVTAWWYTPPQRLRLAGERPGSASAGLSIEVVVEAPAVEGAAEIACAEIAAELSAALSGVIVGVRMHRGGAEPRPLFRIVSQRKPPAASEARSQG